VSVILFCPVTGKLLRSPPRPDLWITALLHHLSLSQLRERFYALKRQASPGVDGVTWAEYETVGQNIGPLGAQCPSPLERKPLGRNPRLPVAYTPFIL
jgi:hypothetical protein